ncbi:MAG: DNA repair protein [Ideonella sp. MAG2]|nr:MAG: DNA repair protein [Ideonella sp. MAG2]
MSDDTSAPPASPQDDVERLVAEGGSYELLKKRLQTQGEALLAKTQALNEARLGAFGRSEQSLLLRTRARTDNNCVARDLVRIGDVLLFGYNVFIGLKKETAVGDVFALYRLAEQGGADELEAVPLAGSFLDDPRFVADFRELHAYYKQATLLQLRVTQDKLLAAFQIGQQLHDLRVFRWSIEPGGGVRYVDNRGERDMALPPTHDFEWTVATREDHVGGKHPHINVLDTIFVETLGGDLTVKVENNTETGLGIYSEPVEDKHQALVDADVAWARLGLLILLRIKPYRESDTRYLVYNTRTQKVERIDAIGVSCVQLPEDHGIIFPGGTYLQSGEFKRFDLPAQLSSSLRFKRMLRSPHGEEVLYVFYQPGGGHYVLFSYHLINKTLAAPIVAHGYARFPDGRILVFLADGDEPTRVHPMQLWQTPFASEEHAASLPRGTGFFAKVGNAELVRGVSDLMGIARAVREQVPTRTAYEDLIRQCTRVSDAYFWLGEPEAQQTGADLQAIVEGARQTLAEFEKVDSIRRETARALQQAEGEQHTLLTDIASTIWRRPDDFVRVLARLRDRRGRLQPLRELRYADLAAIERMDQALQEQQLLVGQKAMAFLADKTAFDGHQQALVQATAALAQAQTSPALGKLLEALDGQAAGLDLLTEQLGSLPGGDAVVRTAILDRISSLYGDINRLRAEARSRRKSLGATEAAAEFGAQFKLFGQAVENALEFADSPEKCDEALTRLLAQLEELEGRFADHEVFISDVATQREAVVDALAARRQTLVEARQRRAQAVSDAAGRILDGIPRRVAGFTELAQIHAYFAGDPLLAKLQQLMADLRGLGAQVQADDIATRLKTARDQALRAVRDKSELVAADGNTLRFGRHAFTIQRQPLDLSLVPSQQGLSFQITGTDYLVPVNDVRLEPFKARWDQALLSETPDLSRAEYLAGCLVQSALRGDQGLEWPGLVAAAMVGEDANPAPTLLETVRTFAAPRYQEGYQKGVHDQDAARLAAALIRMQDAAGLLAWGPSERSLALLYWQHGAATDARDVLQRRARAAMKMQQLFAARSALEALEEDTARALQAFALEFQPGLGHADTTEPPDADLQATRCAQAGAYLVRQLAQQESAQASWVISGPAADLAEALKRELERGGRWAEWQRDLDASAPPERWRMARDWVRAFAQHQAQDAEGWVDEAATALCLALPRQRQSVALVTRVEGLLSEHVRITQGALDLNLNDFWQRFVHHQQRIVPAFEAWHRLRHELVSEEKKRLRLHQFQAKPLSTFVRNRLIDELYLPLIGNNLAKQIGAAGDAARSDRMGMLLLISPPGYGKTTLMEYVADRLGMVFVRINCPALGHDVVSIDPASAEHSAARQELEKLNLGLAMGNNVMLYLDDIQHTNPEFLQKFIALADGTRRMEGVWRGEPRSYDLRGKRFAIVMAGNPYTESGDVFKIPDMLANRADIYNLGDVLSGREALFALSYLENALTANPVLLPLSSRDPKDVHLLVQRAEGQDVPSTAFSHPYGAAELEELTALFKRLFRARDLLLKVNLSYIESAAQQDDYRTEPPFKLQGSYRNMTKLAAQITPQMRDEELDALLRDHYRGEAQTLTTGAEENLLKLAHLLGSPTPDEAKRWQAICEDFVRQRKLGGKDTDASTRITAGLLDVARSVDALKKAESETPSESLRMADALLEIAVTYRTILLPLISATEQRLKLDASIRGQVEKVAQELDNLRSRRPAEPGGAGSKKAGPPDSKAR